MIATRRSGFDSSLEQIYETCLKKLLARESGVRGFSMSGFDFSLEQIYETCLKNS
jgi:hypothetical protein